MSARRPHFLGVAAALVLFAVGITGSAGAQGLDDVQVTVSIDTAAAGSNYVDPESVGAILVDQPLMIVIRGLEPTDAINLRVTSTDARRDEEYPKGVLWQSDPEWSTEHTVGLFPTYENGALTLPAQNPFARVTEEKDYQGDPCHLKFDDIMRLFGEMKPYNPETPDTPIAEHGTGLDYVWSPDTNSGTFTVEVRVKRGGDPPDVKSASVVRSVGDTETKPDPTNSEPWQLNTTGTPTTGIHWYGQFFDPPAASGSGFHAGILLFGGSEGGLHKKLVLAARLLAAHGYTTLALAYWKGLPPDSTPTDQETQVNASPGPAPTDRNEAAVNGVPYKYWAALPASLQGIPLETVRSALATLAEHPDVRNDRLFISGTSRGSEAALWLASDEDFVGEIYVPSDTDSTMNEKLQIFGVAANVPSSTMHRCYDPAVMDCESAAWIRLDHEPVPFAHADEDSNADPPGTPSPTIPVQEMEIDGPVFLDCGMDDHVWRVPDETGCKFLDALVANLVQNVKRKTESKTTLAFKCPSAGHGVGTLVPYVPSDPKDVDAASPYPSVWGSSLRDKGRFENQAAYAALWPQLLQLLRETSG